MSNVRRLVLKNTEVDDLVRRSNVCRLRGTGMLVTDFDRYKLLFILLFGSTRFVVVLRNGKYLFILTSSWEAPIKRKITGILL